MLTAEISSVDQRAGIENTIRLIVGWFDQLSPGRFRRNLAYLFYAASTIRGVGEAQFRVRESLIELWEDAIKEQVAHSLTVRDFRKMLHLIFVLPELPLADQMRLQEQLLVVIKEETFAVGSLLWSLSQHVSLTLSTPDLADCTATEQKVHLIGYIGTLIDTEFARFEVTVKRETISAFIRAYYESRGYLTVQDETAYLAFQLPGKQEFSTVTLTYVGSTMLISVGSG